ncbi:MAG: hypothetical protein QOE76_974 [Frankiales bacterium]|nr:hypothetical protein [Frankiales bacterium]MDX6243251.1 hypothetical protein [Frankiales bacterium]
MQIDKAQVIDLLKSLGKHDQVPAAQSELPEKVDTEQHADLLSKFGINAGDLGGLGGIAGKLGL